MAGFDAFMSTDFDWVVHLDDVWCDQSYDVPALHAELRDEISQEARNLDRPASPLGRMVLGLAGSGKSHLLGALRRQAFADDVAFIFVDMTDVHDFYETVLLGFVSSLLQPDATGQPQFRTLLRWLVDDVGAPESGEVYVSKMERCDKTRLLDLSNRIKRLLHKKHSGATLQYHDVLRGAGPHERGRHKRAKRGPCMAARHADGVGGFKNV